MYKLLLLVLLSVSHINADTTPDEKVEVYATSMDTKENIIKAYGEVVVVYQDYHLSAEKAVYDKNNGVLELFGNVRATKDNNIQLLGDYAKLNISKKERIFKPFFMLEKTSNVWMSGCESFAQDVEVSIKSGVMSGCNPNDPLWTMEFSSADYNTDTMWLDIYNARIYIYDIPVFYAPYFGYSLDTTRKTGLLPPMVGLSDNEGFYYEQALFIAESNWWDLELKPQIRTSRGTGIYSTLRFVDSKASKGSLTVGYFKEKNKYFLDPDNSLANQSHYGLNFNYDNRNFINQWFDLDLKGQSGLYVDINDMNDVEYINLSTNDVTQTSTATQVYSRINLFYNTDENYFGSYFKYFKDLTSDSNNETLQNLPSIQYHRYIDSLLENHFLYSLDVKTNNYYRKVGKTAIQTDINIPLTLQTSLFDEYMNISYKTNLYAQHTSFRGDEEVLTTNEYNNGYFGRNNHTFSASSQLTKAYDEYTHVLDFGAQYIVAGGETRDGYYKEQQDYCSLAINQTEPICEFYNISDVEENLQLYFSQYIYGDDGKQMIYHRMAQSYSYEDVNGGAGELENELDYQINENFNFYNNMFYNYDESSFSKNFNKITYHDDSFNIGLSYMYQNTFLPKTVIYTPYTSYITSSIDYKYSKHYSYNFKLDYDLEQSEKKRLEVGFLYQKRCWDFGLRYVENNRPTLNQSGTSSSIYDRYIYITIALKPVMSSQSKAPGFAYRLPNSAQD